MECYEALRRVARAVEATPGGPLVDLMANPRRHDRLHGIPTLQPSSRRTALLVALFAVVTGNQCAPRHDDAGSDLPIFMSSLLKDIDLENGDGPVVMGVNDLAVDSTGHLFVLDAMAGRLHKYDTSGNYVASLSDTVGNAIFLRQPVGASPTGVAVGQDGNIYVTGAPRDMFPNRLWDSVAVSRISPDLAIDAVYRFGRTQSLVRLDVWRDKLVVALDRPRDLVERFLGYSDEHVKANEELLAMTYAGTPTMYFHPADERKHGVPYWGGWFGTFVAATDDELLVVNSLYPVHRYGPGGEAAGTFGDPSPSFRQPSRPEPRSFPTANAAYYEWRNSFTTIDGIHVLADSLVVVLLVDRDGDTHAAIEKRWRADVFKLNSGEVVARDVALEGDVLHADTLLYVAWRPTEEGWHIGLFDLREEGAR